MAQRGQVTYLRSHSLCLDMQGLDASHLSRVCTCRNSAGLTPSPTTGSERLGGCMQPGQLVLLDGVMDEIVSSPKFIF